MIRLVQRKLIIPRGDTGSFNIPIIAVSTSQMDVAVFTIFDCVTHTKMFQKTAQPTGETLTFVFTHNDTVNLLPGRYVWDIKFYKNPQYAEGELVGGDEIDSYYAGFKLPECEIRETGDDLLVSPDAPTGKLSPAQLDIITDAIAEAQEAVAKTETNVEHYPYVGENNDWYLWDADAGEFVDTGVCAIGPGVPAGGTTGQLLKKASNTDYDAEWVDDVYATKADTVLETTLSLGRNPDSEVGTNSVALGTNVTASGEYSIAIGQSTTAQSVGSFAQGINTQAIGISSVATGQLTTASGFLSHAEGTETTASGQNSHSEGSHTTAAGLNSHAEGKNTIASGQSSHVSGEFNVEDSYNSWPEWTPNTEYAVGDKVKVTTTESNEVVVKGYTCRTANNDEVFTSSKWRLDKFKNFVQIVGNGTSNSARSNAFALTWTGDGKYAGDVYVHANSDSTGGDKVLVASDIAGKANSADLSTVATSGSYNDLNDKPTIPDIQINDTSIVSNGVANIPIANANAFGVIQVDNSYGIGISQAGTLQTSAPSETQIKNANKTAGTYRPIVPSVQHISTFYGLATAAGDTTQKSSENSVGTYTSEAKAAIQSMLGVPSLDANGKVPATQLPSYVDDVLEYANLAAFPAEGESGKIYIALDTNLTYRWSGSAYVEISQSLALGETSSTAYRGDYGAAAYAHGITNKGSAFESGLYKITTNSEGHVTNAAAVQKSDLTDLGVADANDLSGKADKADTVLDTTLSRGRAANTEVGTGSFAFGDSVTASGAYAHAEGRRTSAVHQGAHAEGLGTTAHYAAHAEGEDTIARGQWSHAEGCNSQAIGAASYAGGKNTIANGTASHVFGEVNVPDSYDNWPAWEANTEYSVGDKVTRVQTINNESTTVGYICKEANSDSTFTIAHWDFDSNHMNYAEIVGNGTITEDPETHEEVRNGVNIRTLDWYGNEHLKGDVYVQDSANGAGGVKVATISDIPVEYGNEMSSIQSKAFVNNNVLYSAQANGIASVAMGVNVIAGNTGAMATGVGNAALGSRSHVEGEGNIAISTSTHAEGYCRYVQGRFAHGEGAGLTYSIYLTGNVGDQTLTYTTEYQDIAANDYLYKNNMLHKIISIDKANSTITLDIPFNETLNNTGVTLIAPSVKGDSSHGEGQKTLVNADSSHAEGYETVVTGNYSHAEGFRTSATKVYTHAEGNSSIASGSCAHAEGNYTEASGAVQHVQGKYNVVDSYDNWQEWVANTSYIVGDKIKRTINSQATGYICKTDNNDAEFIETNWKKDSYKNYADIVGNGISTARSNAYALTWEGDGKYAGDVYVGCNSDSTGGTKLAKITDIPSIPVSDVQINGSSILSSGVANVPMASTSNLGVIKLNNTYGIVGNPYTGEITISPASSANAKGGAEVYKPLSPVRQHESTFYGLAKAAGADMKDIVDTTVGTYPDVQKGAIQHMLGTDINLAPYEGDTTSDAAYAIGEIFMLNGRLHKATAAIAIGDTFTVGTNCAIASASEVFPHDIQVNGTSILQNGVANIPKATENQLGAVMPNSMYGISMFSAGGLYLNQPTDEQYKTGNTTGYRAVMVSGEHKAAFYGLAKAAGDTTQAQSNNSVGTYTDEAKAAIRTMLDVPSTSDIPESSVADVQIDEFSIVDAYGIANIPLANEGSKGVVAINNQYGIGITDGGDLETIAAESEDIQYGTDEYEPIVPYHQHESVFYGLARAAGDDTMEETDPEEYPVGSYTDAAKAAIRTMIGAGTPVDVQINSSSIVNNGVANIPYATSSTPGVVIVNSTYSPLTQWTHPSDGKTYLVLNLGNANEVKEGNSVTKPSSIARQHEAAFYGLAKAAGDTSQASSSNAVGTYTAEAKTAIQQMLGVGMSRVSVSGSTPSITAESNKLYICGEVSTLSITPPASGIFGVIFESGSTATVLTLGSGITCPEWFDPDNLEADTIYELNINEGLLTVGTWEVV